MLEGFAAWILNTYIGDYFGNVNTHQLRMSLKNGEIQLEHLPVKRDLIKYLGLPLEAKTGFIGKISIKFPSWHLFTSEPLVITVEDLFLIVKPITNFAYNEEEENRAQQEFKISQLDKMEQQWKALHDEDLTEPSTYYSSSYSSWLNYGSSLINNILTNIHLKISSIHIRYEDNSTIPCCMFATGIIVRSLTICSTDEKWEPKYVTQVNSGNNENFLFKLIDLQSFSCYCDTETTLFSQMDFNDMVQCMRQTLDKNLNRKGMEVEHGYLIAPVNGKCFMKRNCSEMSLKSCKQPRTVIDVQLERVPIMMTAIQYKHLLDWSLAFQTQKTLWRYRKWRPMIHQNKTFIKKDLEVDDNDNSIRYEFEPKTWWHFAINANLEEYRKRRQRFNWHFICNRSRDVVAYHNAYLNYLLYQELFTKEMKYVKDRVENEFTLDELCSIRELVFWKANEILKKQLIPSNNKTNELNESMKANEPEQSAQQFSIYNLLTSFYYYNSTSTVETQNDSDKLLLNDNNENKLESSNEDSSKGKKHRRNASSSSINANNTTKDIFLTRDAIFCQFNFQIHNSSFQLIAFSSDEQDNDQTYISSMSFEKEQRNLLLEFEFNQMKIGIDVTNPNAYACHCHHRGSISFDIDNLQLTQLESKTLLTQNELNQLQIDLNFECQNLNLTLLRTDTAIISDTDMQKLASAQFTGAGINFRFSSDFISIDGRMESLELLDLITAPKINKHNRVLSIGKNMEKQSSLNEPLTVEKALSFSLSRKMNENLLRINVEMASFCYVHSALFVYELSLCRKCFSDVLEAYFSRAFKERVKAATTEVLRGIVPTEENDSNSTSSSNDINSQTKSSKPKIKLTSQQSSTSASSSRRKVSQKTLNHNRSPFVDNLRLNIFIQSPVIICPISPSSYEVVVFHLGHMLLNNHNHSSDHFTLSPSSSSVSSQFSFRQRQRKLGTGFKPASISTASTTSSHVNNSYNAEIRDLSVYSLNCTKNIQKFQPETPSNGTELPQTTISVEQLYHCDLFGVPILQKTIIEIVLERKILFSSMPDSTSRLKKSSDLSASSNTVDGLNLISSVNSIDPLVVPKKISLRQYLAPELNALNNAVNVNDLKHNLNKDAKSEMVLSIEISSIDVRFSYTDLLVFWHILNTLTLSENLNKTIDITSIPMAASNPAAISNQSDDEIMELLQQISLSNCDLDVEEFRLRLNNLVDLGFGVRESLQSLALTNGDIIEAAYLLSNSETSVNQRKSPDVLSDQMAHASDDNQSQTTSTTDGIATGTTVSGGSNQKSMKNKKNRKQRESNFLFSILSVIEIKIFNGSVRIIDDCNQLDLPLLELGITDFGLMQYYTSPKVEAHSQTNFYCNYYNSHLSGWEPFVENCQLAFSWKYHEPRCHLKSMLNTVSIGTTNRIPVARQKLAIKIDISKMFNINISRTMLDIIERVHYSWRNDIENFMNLPKDQRAFRHRQPFIPFALKNETGTELKMFICNNNKLFSTAKAPDLITPCELKPILDVHTDRVVYFDCVDLQQEDNSLKHNYARVISRFSTISTTTSPLKIYVKVDGWKATFPLSIEREGIFIRHIISERYTNQSAILVFEIKLQSTAIKLITVRSSLLITNRTTKTVELKFVNTAMSDVKTSYMICPNGIFPVPLDLLYARIQLRPCDLGIGTCSTFINWNHVRKFGELDCSLQICTPITHTHHGSYSKSQPYVVSVLVERNSAGALIESRNAFPSSTPLITFPSHTITLLPPLQLANRLPYELRFKISIINNTSSSNSGATTTVGTIKAGDDYSVHYISPLEPFNIEFQMEHFPRCRKLYIEPGAIKNYQTFINMYDSNNRLLILNAHVTVQTGSQNPSNAMTITIYAPYWIVNRSGLPLIFAQEPGINAVQEASGQYEEHEKARSISPLLFNFAHAEFPQYCIMRLGKMLPHMSPRWCNLFCLEKGTFYRRLRVTEHFEDSQESKEKIYEFGIDIRQGRDRYNQTKIVTIAPRFQIENLTSFKLEFAQKCLVDRMSGQQPGSNNYYNDANGFSPSYMSSPMKSGLRSGSFSKNIDPPPSQSQIISALPKSNMPFHWQETDRPKLLCVRIASIIGCLWSGCFDVGAEPSVSFQLNIRDETGQSNFIRVEILLQNATYFIVFTDANSLPPPIRVENFSQVAIEFCQVGSSHRTVVRSNSSVPYALDEPTQLSHLTVCAPGGSTSTYDLNSFAPGNTLTYDNFYYLAFEETFSSANFCMNYIDDESEQLMYMMMTGENVSFMENEMKMLVLDVSDEENKSYSNEQQPPKSVILGRKERGKRSQLWRQDKTNHLIHEGTSPPLEPPGFQDFGFADVKFVSQNRSQTLMVLDVLDDDLVNTSDRPLTSIPLAVRKMNSSRSSTQTWHFTEDGRLRCLKYWNMFVQPLVNDSDVFQNGAKAVIAFGPPESSVTKATIPKEQAISKQKMRKGSGVLNVSILADGPSRVLRIKDNQLTANGRQLNLVHFNANNNHNHYFMNGQFGSQLNDLIQPQPETQSFLMRLLNKMELELNLHICSVGLSIISKHNEEIIFLYMKKIILELICNPAECRLNCVVEDFQIDNQLLDCEKEVVLYVKNLDTEQNQNHERNAIVPNIVMERPAIIFNLHKLFIPNVEINVFKSLQMSINDLVLNIEELVLLKLLEFINYNPIDSEMDEISSSSGSGRNNNSAISNSSNILLYQASGNVISSSLSRSVQYFFAYLLIQLQRVKLSVFTSTTSIGKYLTELKKKAGIKLIRFEEAFIQLKPFRKVYSLMTRKFLQDSIHEHYRSELRSQAAKILGTVDFLGNPVGLLNNVVDGLNEFYYEKSIRGLIRNVTHGISDSTAKVTSVLSDSLDLVTMDDRHHEIRQKIRQQTGGIGGQRSHLVIGAFSLAHGILGGITSVITQTYDGIFNHGGVVGFVSGLSKGVLGTFTKPAVGMLDFASGAATAVRDSSRKACFNINGRQVKRVRLPRTLTIDGRLTRYQWQQSLWQSRFYNTTDFGSQREYGEQFVCVFSLSEHHFVLVTRERLYFFHSPVKKYHLMESSDLEGIDINFDDSNEMEFQQQQDLILTNCPIQQLQILPLENFHECIAHRMLLHEGQYFIQTNSTCTNLTISESTVQTSNTRDLQKNQQAVCHFIEFRQRLKYWDNNDYSNGSPATSENRQHKLSFEYPRHLKPCYVYCDCPERIQKIIQLINEAKHLQEERKFEESNL